MTNTHWYSTALFILLFGLVSQISRAETQRTVGIVRPITLKVTDSCTKQPISGITVRYIVERGTYRTRILGIFPPIESDLRHEIISKLSAVTDTNGEVKFEMVDAKLEPHYLFSRIDKVDNATFFINLQPSAGARNLRSDRASDDYEYLNMDWPQFELSESINQRYMGYVLSLVDIQEAHGREERVTTIHFMPENFDQDELEKKITTSLRCNPEQTSKEKAKTLIPSSQ